MRAVAAALASVLAGALLSVPALSGVPSAEAGARGQVGRTAVELPWPAAPAQVEAAPAQPHHLPAPDHVLPVPPPAPAPGRAPRVRRPAQPAPAPAPTAEERGRAALASLHYPWQELGYSIRFQPSDGSRLLGLTDAGSRTITVFVRRGQSEQSLRTTIAHEIGHALDFTTGDQAQRARYRELRGIAADAAWYPCRGCPDFDSPAGDWAEVFALWLAGPGDFRSQVAGPPDSETLRAIARLFVPPSQRRSAHPPPPAPRPSPSPTDKPLLSIVSSGL